ncbi:MAG: hypothetical protein IT458_03635 [Planctomycetes bacterium]|nr:hypothetical protein [Planctomycetota bacterium]
MASIGWSQHIDNHLAQRALRRFAAGSKNLLCIQSEGSAETAALPAIRLQTLRAVGIDPKACFRHVLLRIGCEGDVTRMTPHGWKHHIAQDSADHDEDNSCGLRDPFAEAK